MNQEARGHLKDLQWRTGRRVGRTIYAQVGLGPSDDDVLIGVMDTRALAEDAVESHNHFRRWSA